MICAFLLNYLLNDEDSLRNNYDYDLSYITFIFIWKGSAERWSVYENAEHGNSETHRGDILLRS